MRLPRSRHCHSSAAEWDLGSASCRQWCSGRPQGGWQECTSAVEADLLLSMTRTRRQQALHLSLTPCRQSRSPCGTHVKQCGANDLHEHHGPELMHPRGIMLGRASCKSTNSSDMSHFELRTHFAMLHPSSMPSLACSQQTVQLLGRLL